MDPFTLILVGTTGFFYVLAAWHAWVGRAPDDD
jgi:hypothetical protein